MCIHEFILSCEYGGASQLVLVQKFMIYNKIFYSKGISSYSSCEQQKVGVVFSFSPLNFLLKNFN